ncbi:sugar nucleotide-binding protein [Hymenobacter telluris]|uniref:sugar nucleotide-binding protein n=1 Tax=Hymenobacter telluris TaxID=2816474 RepID=UPI001A8EA556|nr:sugar nucleotide-binding protein [Hymenobacter telluris]
MPAYFFTTDQPCARVRRGPAFQAADDVLISPAYVPDSVNVSLGLLIDEERGVWHLANQGAYTWAQFASLAADMAGLDQSFVLPCSMRACGLPVTRPAYSVLGSKPGSLLPAVADWLHECVGEPMPKLRLEPEKAIALAS